MLNSTEKLNKRRNAIVEQNTADYGVDSPGINVNWGHMLHVQNGKNNGAVPVPNPHLPHVYLL